MTRSRVPGRRGAGGHTTDGRGCRAGNPSGKNTTTLIASMTLVEGAMGPAMAVEGATTDRHVVFEAYTSSASWRHRSRRAKSCFWTTSGRTRPRGCASSSRRWVRGVVPATVLAGHEPHRGGVLEGQGALLKKAVARTKEVLIEAIAEALAVVTPENARGWFAHSGYGTPDQRL